jgi:hypothetical protein
MFKWKVSSFFLKSSKIKKINTCIQVQKSTYKCKSLRTSAKVYVQVKISECCVYNMCELGGLVVLD